MISLVITADSPNVDCVQKDKDFADLLAKFKKPFEILYVTNEDFVHLDDLRYIAKNNVNRKLVVTTKSTNKNTQIYTALDHTDNGDVLLATLDTNLELIQVILQKRQDEAELVFVKQKESFFKSMFTGLGKWTYNFGLRRLGRGADMCCDSQVLLLNNRSVNTIILNPALSKALRIVNPDPERTTRMVAAPKIYDNPTPEQKKASVPFFTLGIATLFYFIGFLLIAVAFPLNNSNVYTIWILVALILWVLAGIVSSVIIAKYTYSTRIGLPIALDLSGEPVINIHSLVLNQQEIDSEGRLVDDDDDDGENKQSEPVKTQSKKSALSEQASKLNQQKSENKEKTGAKETKEKAKKQEENKDNDKPKKAKAA